MNNMLSIVFLLIFPYFKGFLLQKTDKPRLFLQHIITLANYSAASVITAVGTSTPADFASCLELRLSSRTI